MAGRKPVYVEPADYFPESIRKKAGLGEYDSQVNAESEEGEAYLTDCAGIQPEPPLDR